jgi:hypothetical protein
VQPVFNDTRLDWGFEAIRDRQFKVQQAFYIDRLNLRQGDRMTTVEVNQLIQEQHRLLGPMLGRQETEFLRPFVDRVLDMMIETDGGSGEIIGVPPDILQEQELDVSYSSPIARAQRIHEAETMQQALAASAPLMQLDPTTIDVIDTEQIVRLNFKTYGADQRAIRRRAEVEAIREARQQAQQQALQMQQEMQQAEVASKVGPLLKP